MPASLALKIQRLPSRRKQVLVLTRVAVVRSEIGWAAPAEVTALYEALRIEAPNVSAHLGHLRAEGLVLRRASGGLWSITPEGREAVGELLADLDYRALEAEMSETVGATYLRALNPVLDPALAPLRWAAGIARLHERFPFDTNVFCMTRFPKSGERALPDPAGATISILREAAADHGLTLHVAWDRQVEDNLLGNVGAYMWGSRYGIGILEDRAGSGLNYNVVTELGSMLIWCVAAPFCEIGHRRTCRVIWVPRFSNPSTSTMLSQCVTRLTAGCRKTSGSHAARGVHL